MTLKWSNKIFLDKKKLLVDRSITRESKTYPLPLLSSLGSTDYVLDPDLG